MSRNSGCDFYFETFRSEAGEQWEVGRFRVLAELEFVVHLVTTKQGPDPARIAADRPAAAQLLARALNLGQIAWCRQVHGDTVFEAEAGGLVGDGDGMVTNANSLGLMICGADCPLILAAEPVSRSIAVAHASWRGTAGRIASKLIAALVGRFAARSENVIACIGPSAGPCCYQVGQDVRIAAIEGIGQHAERFFLRRDGRLYFDLWSANSDELTRAGVRRENIYLSDECTICNSDRFPSYRAEGESAGRFAAVIAIAAR